MTLPSILTTARTLSYYTRLQEVVANNLANVNSDGYKADRLTAQNIGGTGYPVPVQTLDLRQGTLRETGRELDVALQGDGFLVVQTPDGERLIRGGSLAVDRAGFLADRHGNLLLGADGPMRVLGKEIRIEPDGTVLVDEARAGRLRMEVVADPARLRKEGEGRFLAEAGAATPAASLTLQQGALEEANVNSLLGTVDMIMVQRAYAANIEALRAMDGVMGTLTSQIGGR